VYCGKKSISGAFELIDSRWRSTAPTAHSEAQRATSVCARSVHEFPPCSPLSTARTREQARRPGSLARAPSDMQCIFHSPNIHSCTASGTSCASEAPPGAPPPPAPPPAAAAQIDREFLS
jgi:hypothetical protein